MMRSRVFSILLLGSVVAAACGGSARHELGSGADIDNRGEAGGPPVEGGVGGTMMPTGGVDIGSGGTSGAAPTTGTGGLGAIPPPDKCVYDLPSWNEGEGRCEIVLLCENESTSTTGFMDYLKVICGGDVDGTWVCGCSTTQKNQSYRLGGVKDLVACQAAAELCHSEAGPTAAGELECSLSLEERSASSCRIRELCSQQIEGTAGANLSTVNEVQCEDDGNRRLACKCSNTSYSYQLAGEDGLTACDTVLELCDDPVEPDFTGAAWDCQVGSSSGLMGWSCENHQDCVRSVAIAGDISAVQAGDLGVFCFGGEDDERCECRASFGLFRLESAELTGDALCTEGSEVCKELADVDFDGGEPTCSNSRQAADATTCFSRFDCSIFKSVSGMEASVFGIIDLECGRTDDAWDCTCSSGSNSLELDLEGTDGWEVCTSASETCIDEIEFQYQRAVFTPEPPMPGG
jgi:hypothetical protein